MIDKLDLVTMHVACLYSFEILDIARNCLGSFEIPIEKSIDNRY